MNFDLTYTLMNLFAFVFAGSVHEWAHAFSARLMGDRTAYDQGRMTINPMAHIDVLGTIILPLLRAVSGIPVLGWMRPVPINPYNFKNPSKGMALSAIAGPLSNLLQASIAIFLLGIIFRIGNMLQLSLIFYLYQFFTLYYIINISLVVFNMLPIPPLDGSKVLRHGLSPQNQIRLDQFSRFGGIALYVLLYAGVFRVVLNPVLGAAYAFLYLMLSLNLFISLMPIAAVTLIFVLLFRSYGKEAKAQIRLVTKSSDSLFDEQAMRTRSNNEALKKTASILLEKKNEGTLNTMIDKKMLTRIEEQMDSFSKLCTTRVIDPQEERCLDCSYYANCLMRELDLAVLSGETK